MKKNKTSYSLIVGKTIGIALLIIMLVSFFYTPYGVNEMNFSKKLQSPSLEHLLGTDNFGRDILSRIMQGTQTAFLVGLIAVFIGVTVGTVVGAIAGYFGGLIDEIVMRIIDGMMAFPGLLFAIMVVAILGPGLWNSIWTLGIIAIPYFSRVARSGFIWGKEMEYVEAARVMGASHSRIMFIHIFPNILSPILVAISTSLAAAIIAESSLSYLGLGVKPPHPSWGNMLKESQTYILKAPWFALAPGIMICLSVLSFNLIGDGLRDVRDLKA